MKVAALQLVSPIEHIIAPVPTEWAVAKVAHPAGDLVVIQISTPTGVQLIFLSQESAKGLAEAIGQCTSPILIAPAGSRIKP